MATAETPSNRGRIALFFIGYMGLFVLALPALLLAIYQSQVGSLDRSPPTAQVGFAPEWTVADGHFTDAGRLLGAAGPVVDARAVVPGAVAAAAAVNPDGSLAVAAIGPGDIGAALAANYRVTETNADGHVKTQDGMQGQLLAEPGRALLVLGMDHGTAEARAGTVAGLTRLESGPPPKVATSSQRWTALAFLVFWVLLQFFLFGRVASWAASVPPPAGTKPVSVNELKQRLLRLMALDQPFEVRDEGDELVADWKWHDAKWLQLFRLNGARRANRIVLQLDPQTRTVGAQDRSATLDWDAGVNGAQLQWRAERGIRFLDYQARRELGLLWKNGEPELVLTHQWRFDLNEMKQPLIRAVREAGWTWRPVVTFVRAFGG